MSRAHVSPSIVKMGYTYIMFMSVYMYTTNSGAHFVRPLLVPVFVTV